MEDIAEHVRIFEPNPNDDFVTKRVAAITVVAKGLKTGMGFDELLTVADDISTSLFDPNVGVSPICVKMVDALKAESPSFSPVDDALQVTVCAALAVLEFIRDAEPAKSGVTAPVFLGFALWSGLSYQKPMKEPKLETLRNAILNEAHKLTLESANIARQRLSIPDMPDDEETDTASEDFNNAVSETFKSLNLNAALDREELDILWWVLGNWSGIVEDRLDTMSELSRTIVSGIEVSNMLRRIPSDGHRHLVLRGVDDNEGFTLTNVLTELKDLKALLKKHFTGEPRIERNRAVVPLLYAICEGSTGSPFGREKIKVSDWGSRALLEASLLRIARLPVPLV